MTSIRKRTYKNAKGEEVIRWRVQEVINGKVVEFTSIDKNIALDKLRHYKNELELYGNVITKSGYTLAEWTEKHLFTNKLPQVSAGTFQMYKGLFDNYILGTKLGKTPLTDIKKINIQEFLNTHTELAHSTLRKIYLLISQTFDSAVDNDLVRINPCKGVVVPNKNKETKPIQVFTLEDQRNYMIALENEIHRPFFMTALFTGLRQGELIALKWRNVDIEEKIIYVKESIRKTKVYKPNGTSENTFVTKPPKSKAGIRSVPIPNSLIPILSAIRPTGTIDDIGDEYVFKTKTGNPHTSRNIIKYHERICRKAKINPMVIKDKKGNEQIVYQGINFHALRHTYATRMLEAGEAAKTVQVLLGHKDIQTTLNIYTHVLEETKKASADKQDALFVELMK